MGIRLEDLIKNPGTGSVSLQVEGVAGDYNIEGAVISSFTVEGQDIQQLVEESGEVSFTIGGTNYKIEITRKDKLDGFYYLDLATTPIEIPGGFTDNSVSYGIADFLFIPVTRVGYRNSDYNPVINNVSISRLSSTFRVVDRFLDEDGKPVTNQGEILINPRSFANVQDFNLARKGSINSKYLGTKLTAIGTVKKLDVDGKTRIVADERKDDFAAAYSSSVTTLYGENLPSFSGSSYPIPQYTGDEPFKGLRSFKGAIQPYVSDTTAMKGTLLGTTELVDIYFEPKIVVNKYQEVGDPPVLLSDLPELGSVIFSGNRFDKVVSAKILSIDSGLVYRVNSRGFVDKVD